MTVTNGQLGNQTTLNNAFMSRTSDTSTTGGIDVGGDLDVSGNVIQSVQAGVVAFAGGGQGSATQLTADVVFVSTVASSGDSVKLPSAVSGLRIVVFNGGANSLDLFPATGDQIDGSGVNVAIALLPGETATAYSSGATDWFTDIAGARISTAGVDNSVARFDGPSGHFLSGSSVFVNDDGDLGIGATQYAYDTGYYGANSDVVTIGDAAATDAQVIIFKNSTGEAFFYTDSTITEFQISTKADGKSLDFYPNENHCARFRSDGAAEFILGVYFNGDTIYFNGKAASFQKPGGGAGVAIRSPAGLTGDYILEWPTSQGAASTFLQNDGSGNLSWTAASTAAASDAQFILAGQVFS